MNKRGRLFLAAALTLGAAGWAHVRLYNPGTGAELFWANPANISIVINDAGSDNVADSSVGMALKNSIDAWNHADGATAQLVENTSPSQKARTDWSSSSIHTMWFDETNSSGYFPVGSGTVAITPIWFFGNGTISDADVLFNGKGFGFTTSGVPGAFDVQDVATHELGHLLGLDHTGVAGGTMYPYVDPTVILHRSLSADDVHGMRDAYPAESFASLSGRVVRSSGGGVAGAWVSARDASGRLAGAALADGSGNYTLRGLDAGTYILFARPLDEPVSSANLTSGHSVATDFEPAYYSTLITLGSGQTKSLGDLSVGSDVTLSLGRSSDNLPLRVVRGANTSLQMHGSALNPGSSLTSGDPSFGVAASNWLGSLVGFSVTVPSNAPLGLVDLEVVDSAGRRSILPGALEVTPPDPVVSTVSPPSGAVGGGTSVIIKGTNFEPGSSVVIGDRIYRDGDPGGSTFLDATTIMLTTAVTIGGAHDVVVIDSTGVEGRLAAGFTSAALPTIDTVFPIAGNNGGGTSMTLRGDSFTAGLVVRIDGQVQDNVNVDSSSRVIVTTKAGVEGGPYLLEVENPGGGIATNAFTFVRPQDPRITSISPSTGTTAGGELVTVTGADFNGKTEVVFGADPDTGIGGVAANSVTVVSNTTLIVEVPSNSGGEKSVLVRQSDTEQADVLAAGFTYTGGGGGGGGGCGATLGSEPFSMQSMLANGLWFVGLLTTLVWRRRRLALVRS